MIGVCMKSCLHLFATFLLVASVADYAEAGKRLDSGGFNNSDSAAASPDITPRNNQISGAQQAIQSKSAGKAMMGGLLGGLLAGGIIFSLLGNGTFEGIQLMDILLLAGLGLLFFKLLHSSKRQPSVPATEPNGYSDIPLDTTSARKHDDLSQIMSGADQNTPIKFPADFDPEAFTQGALSHYRTVQQAWNDANMEEIHSYVGPELYNILAQQHRELSNPPRTEILDLDARIIRADQVGNIRQISILFRGRCRDLLDGSEDGIFDTWHLERDTAQDNASWLIIGIDAE